ncbi:hypothetical protein MTR67_023431 [Solanum verrucosum]|uniref:Reverse transcriptase/retrotransposon-derived protein RNase H-like domain-containing protein n=1 Tax=Solanum verrucosum TaxID=315347 RepID=A0AAF0QV62_SOLVR|nr:hypothetical protein MTR67_023431 [Solanum verrucosum]
MLLPTVCSKFPYYCYSIDQITEQGVGFQWPDECEKSFQNLKTFLTLATMLILLKEGVDFTVCCDDLGVGLGAVLMLKRKGAFLDLHRSPDSQYIVSQRNLNLRKSPSIGILATLSIEKILLARDFQRLSYSHFRLKISEESCGMITFIEDQSFLVKYIRERQFDDEKLYIFRDKVKCEHQQSGGTSQRMPILIRKWEHITINIFALNSTCLPTTVGGYDSIWVVLDKLTESAHFISVQVKYSEEKLAQLYIN